MKIIALLISLILFIILFIYILIHGNIHFINNIKNEFQISSKMPSFNFYNKDNLLFSKKDLSLGKPTIFIHFNSTCEHCQSFAENFYINSNRFYKCQIIFISEENYTLINEFGKKYNLENISFVKLLKSQNDSFYKSFKSSAIPSFFVFDSNQNLIKKFEGEVKIESLIKYVSNK